MFECAVNFYVPTSINAATNITDMSSINIFDTITVNAPLQFIYVAARQAINFFSNSGLMCEDSLAFRLCS